MRIQLPFGLPFEIVGHRPGYPIRGAGPTNANTDANVPPTRSYLPVQIRRVQRPAWANPVAASTAADSAAPPATHGAVAAGGANVANISGVVNVTGGANALHINLTDHASAIATTQIAEHAAAPSAESVAAGLRSVQEWVDSGPDNERLQRQEVGAEFRRCWTSADTAQLQIYFKSTLTSLPTLPPHVTSLMILECGNLRTLPDLSRATKLQNLALGACDSLVTIPDLNANTLLKALHVEGCQGIVVPPDSSACTVLEEITFTACSNMTTFPSLAGRTALKELDLSFCPAIATPVNVAGCTQLQELALRNCSRVPSIDLSGCNQLSRVSLSVCAALTTIPSLGHLQRLSYMDVMQTGITSLPDDIVSLQEDCRILLDATHLSDAVRNRLDHIMNAPGYAGPRIEYTMGDSPVATRARPVVEEVAAWHAEAPVHLQQVLTSFDWSALGQHDNVDAFSIFLGRVRETNDYLHATPALKAATQSRVATLLIQLQSDPVLRENCLNLALDAINTCGDRVAIRLMEMENLATTAAARTAIDAGHYDNNPQALVDLCKGQHRLAIVATEADNKVASLHFTDPIEVHLGYITTLAQSCQLPVQISTMLYPACARVTSDDIAAVTKKLSNAGGSPAEAAANDQAYQHALAASELMRALLHRLQPAQMQAADTDTATLIEQAKNTLHESLDALNPSDENFVQQNRQLMAAFKAVETDLPIQATLPVLHNFLSVRGIDSGLGAA